MLILWSTWKVSVSICPNSSTHWQPLFDRARKHHWKHLLSWAWTTLGSVSPALDSARLCVYSFLHIMEKYHVAAGACTREAEKCETNLLSKWKSHLAHSHLGTPHSLASPQLCTALCPRPWYLPPAPTPAHPFIFNLFIPTPRMSSKARAN